MPERFFEKLNEKLLPQWKACFFAAILTGLAAHLYKITNWLPNWDSLVFRYDPQNMLGLGRWFLPVVCGLSSFYDLPLLNGLLAILFHALGAVCICRIMHVKKTVTACLIGAVTVSFPSVTSVMMYNYVADGYSVAFFLSTLAVLLMTKEKPRYLLAAVLLALSCGIYQAYITVAVMLILMRFIDAILYRGTPIRTVVKKSGFVLLTGISGVLLYAVILKVLLAVFSKELSDYQGISEAGSFSSFDFAGSLYTVKETFLTSFFDLSKGVSLWFVLNVFILIFTLLHYIKYFVKNKIYRRATGIPAFLLLGALLLVGAGALAFLHAEIDYHNLMRMGYLVFYLLFLILYERGTEQNERHAAVKCWTVLLAACLLIANQVIVANVSYHKAQMAYERSYGTLLRIADRIEQTPGAKTCEKLAVLGALENSEAYSVVLPPEITGVTDGFILRADDETVGQSVLCSALNDYCETHFVFVSGEAKEKLSESEAVRAMAVWPEKSSVAVVDDTVVVKLSTEEETK